MIAIGRGNVSHQRFTERIFPYLMRASFNETRFRVVHTLEQKIIYLNVNSVSTCLHKRRFPGYKLVVERVTRIRERRRSEADARVPKVHLTFSYYNSQVL